MNTHAPVKIAAVSFLAVSVSTVIYASLEVPTSSSNVIVQCVKGLSRSGLSRGVTVRDFDRL